MCFSGRVRLCKAYIFAGRLIRMSHRTVASRLHNLPTLTVCKMMHVVWVRAGAVWLVDYLHGGGGCHARKRK
jgi:hypothetical protein